jgi:hypothetical protein
MLARAFLHLQLRFCPPTQNAFCAVRKAIGAKQKNELIE